MNRPHPCPGNCGRQKVYPPRWEGMTLEPEETNRRCPTCHGVFIRSELGRIGVTARVVFRASASGQLCVTSKFEPVDSGVVAENIEWAGHEPRQCGHKFLINWWQIVRAI